MKALPCITTGCNNTTMVFFFPLRKSPCIEASGWPAAGAMYITPLASVG